MLTMDQIHHIRALYYEQGYNISEIAEATGRDWKTVAKYIDMADFNEPLPVPALQKQFCPKLEPYKKTIDSWLEEDKNHPRSVILPGKSSTGSPKSFTTLTVPTALWRNM